MTDVFLEFRFLILLMLCCVCNFPMNDYRFSKKHTIIGLGIFAVMIGVTNLYLMTKTGNYYLWGTLIFSADIPYYILLLLLTKGSLALRIFNIGLWSNISLVFSTVIGIYRYFSPERHLAELLVSAIFFLGYYALYQRFLREKHHRIMRELKINWWIVSIIPVLFVFLFRYICAWPGPLAHNPQNFGKAVAINFMMLAVYGLIFYTFKITAEAAAKKQAAQSLSIQLALQKKYYEASLKKTREAEIFRHDARHRSMLLLSLAENRELERIKELLQKDIISISELTEVEYTQNRMINAVLTEYIRRSQEKGLRVKADIQFSGALSTDETEFCIMLSNLLENAVNAGKSFLELVIKQNKNQLCMNIKNDYSGRNFRDGAGNYISVKAEGSGFGLKSVKATLEKNGGFLRIDDNGEVFNVFASVKNEIIAD